ncbi:DUF4355 domain-containing protein [Metabacillus litoralis]|uniref:DUF4355 domain-containing protein n=1 Tax=Metabacillus litoralis TaxID=152268 RepID=UPI002041C435|nr:DUF4355 domain-containing protein [Metabacillus litoralis]MCM3413532.1 DUF4355 domain-containing protein [Metabacillus litoralis]
MKKKVELLKLNLQHFAELSLDQVKAWLEANKANSEVQTYLGELSTPTVEGVEGFLDTPEGRKLLQPRLDQNFTKGLNTWKEKNLDKLIDDEVKKRNPEKTPEQLEIEKLRQQIEQAEKDRNREKLVNSALKVAKEKNLPDGIIDFFIGEDEEGTNSNLTKLEEQFNAAVKSAVDLKFKSGGREVPGGSGSEASVGADFAKNANGQKDVPQTNIWD